MATVPGQPIQDVTGGIPAELQPGPEHLLMAAAIMDRLGRLAPLEGVGAAAKRWQGFESRFPKESFDPEKAKGEPVDVGTMVPSHQNVYDPQRRQSGGLGLE